MNPDQIIDSLSIQGASDYIGEPVSLLEHSLLAARCAEQAQAPERLILAALLHDVGHCCLPDSKQMGEYGIANHEQIGADFLRDVGLSERVTKLVELHVAAKRYLSAMKPEYLSRLSTASRNTLDFQGGLMSNAELVEFQQLDDFSDALKLRAWDEAAKETQVKLPEVGSYRSMLRRNLAQPLDEQQLSAWRETGFLHIRQWYSRSEMDRVAASTDQLQSLPETPGKWLKYFESGVDGRLLCRIENFAQYESQYNEIVRGDAMINLLSGLMGDGAVLFKEKVNFKLAGGEGFKAHQDAPAFTTFNQNFHVTAMLSIDTSNTQNGCLEVAVGGRCDELLAMDKDLTLNSAVEQSFNWRPIETEPGDLLVFDSYVPHRSAKNESPSARRALYATYNRARDGDVRDAYFQAERESFPPEVERTPGKKYAGGVFNVGNPVNVNE